MYFGLVNYKPFYDLGTGYFVCHFCLSESVVFSFEIFWDTLPDFTRSTMTSTYISPHNLLGVKLFYFRIQLSKIPD